MKMPKYIENAIDQRANHAERFNHYDYIISQWVDKNGVDAENFDIYGGVESIVNPWASAIRLKEAIKNTN